MLSSVEIKNYNQVVEVGDVEIGGEELTVMAGPCAVESREQLLTAAEIVKKSGADILRGGAFKPRTSPNSFQGLGEEGLKYLAEAKEKTGLKIVTEVMDSQDIDLVNQYADILQIGSRNMQNYGLLKELGKVDTPIMLKRGYAAKVKEWLLAAQYVVNYGNPNVILCARGIRTFEPSTRNTLDLNSVALIKEKTDLPIIIDPSHGTGVRELVIPMAKAGVTVGADGVMVEMHPDPGAALCDGEQSLRAEDLTDLMNELNKIASISGKKLAI